MRYNLPEMEFQITLYTIIYILAGITTLVPTWISWRMRKFAGVSSLFLMMLFISAWAFLCAVEMTVVDVAYKRSIVILEDAAFLTFHGMLLLFVLDYFSLEHWLKPAFRKSMWLLPGALLLLDMTDAWHGLVWKDYSLNPIGGNLLLLTPGPVYYIITIILYSMNLFLLILTGYFAIHKTSKVRTQAIFIFIGILTAWLSPLAFVLIPDQALGLSLLPIGFAVCGMLISWVVFEDLLTQSQTLAKDLQASHNSLAERLIDLRQKISGMYDLVYLHTRLNDPQNRISDALEKMRQTMQCDAAAFFLRMDRKYVLDGVAGLNEENQRHLASWEVPAANEPADVAVWPDPSRSLALPVELLNAGFHSAAVKSIHMNEVLDSSVFYLWRAPHTFQVDEIALMGAQVDVLALIIANDQSHHMAQELAVLEERQQLGRELHDRISQDLFSLSIFGASSLHHVTEGVSAALKDDLHAINTLAHELLNEMRLLLYELQPSNRMDDLSLEEAIQRRFAIVESHVNLAASLVVNGCGDLPQPLVRVLYSVVIEALNNVVKYAKAKTIAIQIEANDQQVRLSIRDDGVGFDPNLKNKRGLGLENMRQRVSQFNGNLLIHSEVGQGAVIEAVLPISASTQPRPGGLQ